MTWREREQWMLNLHEHADLIKEARENADQRDDVHPAVQKHDNYATSKGASSADAPDDANVHPRVAAHENHAT